MMWQRWIKCGVYYTQDNPLDTAQLCPDCWKALPHFKVGFLPKPRKGPTHNEAEWRDIILLTLGNMLCLGIIAYYLWR